MGNPKKSDKKVGIFSILGRIRSRIKMKRILNTGLKAMIRIRICLEPKYTMHCTSMEFCQYLHSAHTLKVVQDFLDNPIKLIMNILIIFKQEVFYFAFLVPYLKQKSRYY